MQAQPRPTARYLCSPQRWLANCTRHIVTHDPAPSASRGGTRGSAAPLPEGSRRPASRAQGTPPGQLRRSPSRWLCSAPPASPLAPAPSPTTSPGASATSLVVTLRARLRRAFFFAACGGAPPPCELPSPLEGLPEDALLTLSGSTKGLCGRRVCMRAVALSRARCTAAGWQRTLTHSPASSPLSPCAAVPHGALVLAASPCGGRALALALALDLDGASAPLGTRDCLWLRTLTMAPSKCSEAPLWRCSVVAETGGCGFTATPTGRVVEARVASRTCTQKSG